MKDYSKMEIWELFHFVSDNNCKEIDPYLSNKISSLDSIFAYYWHFALTKTHQLVETREKINSILIDAINNDLIKTIEENEQYDWWKLETLEYWVNEELRSKLLSLWITGDKVNFSSRWIYKHIEPNNDLYLPYRLVR